MRRPEAEAARLVTTRPPRSRAVPSAIPSRSAVSGRQVDVDQARDPVRAEEAGRQPRLPDEVTVDDGARLDLLERIDADARHDDALGADRAVVPDRDSLVEARMRADVAGLAHDRPLDDDAAPEVRGRVDDRAGRARVAAERDALHQDRVRADRGARADPAVVADERRPLDGLQVGQVDSLAHPDVAAEADSRQLQLDAFVERVEVGLPVLVEVADVLPVPLRHVAVERPAHLQEQGEQLLGEVVGTVGRNVPQTSGSST